MNALGELPVEQTNHAKATLGANPKTVVVLYHGNPLSFDWIAAHAPAILEGFEGGQATGTALARVLFGSSIYGPSGVLPWTVYPSNYTSSDLPMSDMSMRAGEGRTYRFYRGEPIFPFGYGLTYASFQLAWAHPTLSEGLSRSLSSLRSSEGGITGIDFALTVTNRDDRMSASKVVSAYVKYLPPWPRPPGIPVHLTDLPIKSLFSIQKVHLLPGDTKEITINTNDLKGYCALCSVSVDGVSQVRPGKYVITIGDGSSQNDLLETVLTLST